MLWVHMSCADEGNRGGVSGAQVPLRHAHTAQDECVQGKTRKTSKTSKMVGYYKSGQTTKEVKQFEMYKKCKKRKRRQNKKQSINIYCRKTKASKTQR